MGIIVYLMFLLKFPSLLLSLMFELLFLLPPLVLGWSQNDGPLEEVENLFYLKPFIEFLGLLFAFEFLPPLLL